MDLFREKKLKYGRTQPEYSGPEFVHGSLNTRQECEQKSLYTQDFVHKSLYTEDFVHKRLYTGEDVQEKACTKWRIP